MVDRRVALAGADDQLQLGKPRNKGAVDGRSLTHRANDIARRELRDQAIAVGDMVLMNLEIDVAKQRPVGRAQRGALVVVENGDLDALSHDEPRAATMPRRVEKRQARRCRPPLLSANADCAESASQNLVD